MDRDPKREVFRQYHSHSFIPTPERSFPFSFSVNAMGLNLGIPRVARSLYSVDSSRRTLPLLIDAPGNAEVARCSRGLATHEQPSVTTINRGAAAAASAARWHVVEMRTNSDDADDARRSYKSTSKLGDLPPRHATK